MPTIDSSKILDQVISTPIYDHCMRIRQMRTHQRNQSLPKVQWFLIISLVHLYLLAMLAGQRSGLCLTALPLYPSLPRYLLMTDSIASPVTDQWLRFEIPSPLISDGFLGILLMVQDDQNRLLQSP